MLRRNVDTTAQLMAAMELKKMNKNAASAAVPPPPPGNGASQIQMLEQRVAALEARVQWCIDAIQQPTEESAGE